MPDAPPGLAVPLHQPRCHGRGAVRIPGGFLAMGWRRRDQLHSVHGHSLALAMRRSFRETRERLANLLPSSFFATKTVTASTSEWQTGAGGSGPATKASWVGVHPTPPPSSLNHSSSKATVAAHQACPRPTRGRLCRCAALERSATIALQVRGDLGGMFVQV